MYKKSLIFFCLLAVTFCGPATAAEDATRPNVMVFLVDDMGVMDTSVPFLTNEQGKAKKYALNEYYRTPGMERLANQGTRFNQFYAMSVCSPTRVSIMTGQNAARHHVTNWINPDRDNRGPLGPEDWNWKGLAPGDVTLPGLLAEQGYRTIHVGKGHFGNRKSPGADPANLGFTDNIGGASFGAPGSYYGTQNFGEGTKRQSHAVPHLADYHGEEIFLTEALTLEAKKRVSDAVKKDQPFYLYFSHYAVHAPFHSDPRFAANYADSGKSKQAQAFATLIEGMDKSLNDMLDHFDQLGVSENTLVLFLGDNGSDAPLGHQHAVACAAPLRGKKGAHYEGGMRVPFIAAWAKRNESLPHQQRFSIPAGHIQSQLGAVHDVFPTVLEVAGIKAPAKHTVDGFSLTSLIAGKQDPSRPQTFLMHYPHAPHRSKYFTVYRDGHWKVIYHYHPSEESENSHYQLYNLATDPFEAENLASTEPQQLARMMQALVASMEAHDGQYPLEAAGGKPAVPVIP